MRVAVTLVLISALVAPAHAAGEDEERARGHFEIGLGLYRLGDYHGALKEFAAGYELAHKPGFLLNLGQTYRKLGELREAREMYRQFLAAIRHDDPARPEAQKVLAEIEEAIRTSPPPSEGPPDAPPATAPAAPAAEPAPVVAAPAPAAAASSSSTVATTAPRPRPRRSLRIAGIALGAGGVALIGGGIGAAVAANATARDLNATDVAGGVFDPSKDRAYTVDRTLSIAFFASGAVIAGAGAILLIVSAR